MTAHAADSRRRVLLILLDGVGIGTKDPRRNPLFAAQPPFLQSLLDGEFPSLRNRRISAAEAECLPLDANLGVAGLPQSGTGQSALYTGVNTARIIGQHFGPYLYSTLKPVVEEHNIFHRLRNGADSGRATLANAFPQRFFDYLEGPRRRMVAGMYAAMAADLRFRDIDDLKRGEAVSTDITAERWARIGHPDAPVVTPRGAGHALARVAAAHDFSLFEYFMTDKAGHDMDADFAARTLQDVDELLRGLHEAAPLDELLVLVTSDHGNMEEIGIKTHTRNPVPLIIFGCRDGFDSRSLISISDIVPAVCSFLA